MKRQILILVVAIAVIVPAFALTQAAPVAAGGSCTGWGSRKTPPKYVRVLITQTGEVKKVPLKRYVAKVMASGEWPSWMHLQALKAGAFATMQYVWYYSLKGKHRGGYSRGRCYDVVNTTDDQLFRPGAKPTKKQWRAVNAVHGYSLWKFRKKSPKFFLTAYRSGNVSVCARDVNGWKLYAKSMHNCAKRRGWSWKRISKKYYTNTYFRRSSALIAAQTG